MNPDTNSFSVVGSGGVLTLAAPLAGDPAQVRNGSEDSMICIVAAFIMTAQAGVKAQVIWPSGHDQMRNWRFGGTSSQVQNSVPLGFPPQLRAQDPFTVSLQSPAGAGVPDVLSLHNYYEDLPGVDARMINVATLRRRG